MEMMNKGLSFAAATDASHFQPIAAPEPASALLREIQSLPAAQHLFNSAKYSVYLATQAQVPRVLLEIGRLREVSFRAVQEGTGLSRDLDRFDEWYMHLFAWDHEEQHIVGAYRLCMTDVALRQWGSDALYTRELFDYDPELLRRLKPAVELGRSFVRPECQGAGRGLALLWRGIGKLIASRPKYRTLLGPVSVSAAYSDASRQLIASVLHAGRYRHPLSSQVRAKRAVGNSSVASVMDTLALSRRVAELEHDKKGLPVLVREYIKLGGQFLSFSVDPEFCDAMDGLVVVDLDRTNTRLLSLYMGPESYEQFRSAGSARAERRPTAAE